MKKLILSTLLSSVFAIPAMASNVAVVDSGTDFLHKMLKNNVYVNTGEIAGNLVDDDHNGKVDDINGWNFIDQRGEVFAASHLNEINPVVYKLIEVIAHQQAGTATDAEKAYWKNSVLALSKDQKTALINHLEYFGTYAHSTHVSGIIVQQNPKARVMSARVFPDEPPDQYTSPSTGLAMDLGISKFAYDLLAAVSNGSFVQVAAYLKEQKMIAANYSLGMSLQTFAKLILGIKGNKKPTAAEIAAETQKAFKEYNPQGLAWMNASPGTLFVIAAGNDGADNDAMPAFPANVRAVNAISVAAIHEDGRLATFSNYGKTTVDVAAPGVAVVSSVPSLTHDTLLPMSGTSMACPYVTGVASRLKEENPALTAPQMRAILMGTVDHKDFLKDKVVSGGIVNPDRAALAAHLAITMDVDHAIAMARTQVADRVLPPAPPVAANAKGLTPQSLVQAADRFVF